MPTEAHDDNLSVRERLIAVAKQNQEPKDRLWAAIIVVIITVLLVGAVTFNYHESNQSFLNESRGLGYERGALDCQTIILDNERTSGIPSYCVKQEVRVFFPPEVCEEFLAHVPDCGREWAEAI